MAYWSFALCDRPATDGFALKRLFCCRTRPRRAWLRSTPWIRRVHSSGGAGGWRLGRVRTRTSPEVWWSNRSELSAALPGSLVRLRWRPGRCRTLLSMVERISVVIPTYGRSRFLAEAVQSVRSQSRPADEIIVVDDCSEEPVSVPGVRIVRHARNMGPAAARNTGLAHASGDLLLFLDDDDTIAPYRLESAVHHIGSARAHAMAVENIYDDGRRSIYGDRFQGDMRGTFSRYMHPAIGQVVHRREDVVQFDPTLRMSEDKEWWLRMRHAADFAWTDAVGLHVRIHHEERKGVTDALRLEARMAVLGRHRQNSDRLTKARLLGDVASAAILARERRLALRYATWALVLNPSSIAGKRLGRAILGR